MPKKTNNIWTRVGIESEERLRWLINFGHLDPAQLTKEQRNTTRQEARAFVALQEIDPALRGQMPFWPTPTDAAGGTLTDAEVWRAQNWLKRGLFSLQHAEKWNFQPRVHYELDVLRGILWLRLKASSGLHQFKVLAYQTFSEARLRFRLCLHCKLAFVSNRGQKYCTKRCSQTIRTKKWRKAHPEKNRAIRRAQYRKATEAKLKLSKVAAIKIAQVRKKKSG